MSARWKDSRKIVKRYVATGELKLKTPASFGGGEGNDLIDMPLACDPTDGSPLLTGTSLAGAARCYLREWELGYGIPADDPHGETSTQLLFGDGLEKESRESWLVVEDSLAKGKNTEIRPSVSINPKTRTALIDEETGKGQLFDMELLEAGTMFPLHFELAIPDDSDKERRLKEGFAIALTGFEKGEIGLGARKSRGLGECEKVDWKIVEYDMLNGGLPAWLGLGDGKTLENGKTLAEKLGMDLSRVKDQRRRFTIDADFTLETTMLIRSGGVDPDAPDMVHLKSKRNGDLKPILSGTSLAGALRARALRIARTQLPDDDADALVYDLFGPQVSEGNDSEAKKASCIIVRERVINADEKHEHKHEHVQTRLKIDRFTGGVYPGGTFDQQPVVGGKDTGLMIELELRNPTDHEIGLVLQLLKDLWTGDLPLGCEASIGRGRLRGEKAILKMQRPDARDIWKIIAQPGDKLAVEGNLERLARYSIAPEKE